VSTTWYMYKGEKQYGPMSLEELRNHGQSGFLKPDDLVWGDGMANWVKAGTVQGVFLSQVPAQNPIYQQGYNQNFQQNYQQQQYVPSGYGQYSQKQAVRKSWKLLWVGVPALLVVMVLAGSYKYFFAKPANKEIVKDMGTFTVSQQGGSYKGDGIEVSVTGSQADKPCNIKISKVDRKNSLPKGVSYRSELYRLEGQLDKVGGKINIKMPIPKEALKEPYKNEEELSKSLYIVLEEDSYIHFDNGVPLQRPLPVKIDLSSNTISASLDVPKSPIGVNERAYFASIDGQVPAVSAAASENESSVITFQIIRYIGGAKELRVDKGNFIVHYPSNGEDDSALEIYNELEKQKKLMEQSGFSFSGCSFPIDVYVQDMDGTIGLYQGSKWSSEQYLYLKDYPYFIESLAGQKKSGNWSEMVTTSGHELLHLVESLYDNTGSFKKNHPWFAKPTLWMDEAVSTWYEPLSIGSANYLPDNAVKNINFINTPLFFPDGDYKKVSNHGYGASLFMRYLTKKLNDNSLPAKVYDEIKKQKTALNPGHALNMAVLSNYGGTQSVEELWPEFLENYLTRPGDVVPKLDTSSLWKKEIYLKASFKDNNYTVSFSGNDAIKGQIKTAKDGNLDKNVAPVVNLHFSMDNLTGDGIRLKIADDSDSKKYFEKPCNIKVKVTNTGKGGVMVYAVPRELRGVSTIAGAPWKFLSSSGDPRRQGGSEKTIGGLSHKDGKGSWKEILLIPFDNNDSLQKSKTEIDVEITCEPMDISGTWLGEWTFNKVHFSGVKVVDGIEMDSNNVRLGAKAPIGFTITNSENGYSADMKELFGYDIDTKSSEFTGNTIKIKATRDVENAFINLTGTLSEDKTTIEGTIEIGHTAHGVLVSGPVKVTRQEEKKQE